MLDFKKRDLYSKDKTKLEKFRNNILVKGSERHLSYDDDDFVESDGFSRVDAVTIVDNAFDFDDGDGGFGGFGGFGDDSFGGFGGFGDDSFGGGFNDNAEDENGITTRGNLSSSQDHLYLANKGRIFVFLTSPIFLFWYMILHISRNNMKVHDWKNELDLIKKINIIVILVSVIFMLLGIKTIIDVKSQLIVGLIMFGGSFIMLKYLEGSFKKKEKDEGSDVGSFEDDGVDDFNDMFSSDDSGFSGMPDFLGGDDDDDDLFSDFGDGDDELFEEFEEAPQPTGFVKSPLDVSDDDKFDTTLLKVFKDNDRYTATGVDNLSRKELVNSFSPYLASNFKNFGEWKEISENSFTYLNIAYTLFLGLEKINPMIGKTTIDADTQTRKYEKLVVLEMKENTMMYKIHVELPTPYKLKTLRSGTEEFRNILKKTENDTDTKLDIDTVGTGFVFKIHKSIKGIISIGDLLRYVDTSSDAEKTTYEEFIDEKKGLPMLMGLTGNEFPKVIDYEDNTSGAIVGGSGSGKSWFTFSMLFNILVANDYHNVQMMIFDKKNAAFWNAYALSPHVVGYHTEVDDLRTIVDEVYAEIDRRKKLLVEVGAENFKSVRSKLRKKGELDELKRFPLLLFIVDEITSTMGELQERDDNGEEYKYIKSVMSKITQEGRSLGVRMLAIGQRSIDNSIPKNVMANSSFKFGMKLDTESDFVPLGMDKIKEKIGAPQTMGMGIMKNQGEEPVMVKTLGVGGMNDDQILHLLRVIGLEWTRRSLNDKFVHETTDSFELGYNRDKFRSMSLEALREGNIIAHNIESGIQYEIDSQGNLLGGIKEKSDKSHSEMLGFVDDDFGEDENLNENSTGFLDDENKFIDFDNGDFDNDDFDTDDSVDKVQTNLNEEGYGNTFIDEDIIIDLTEDTKIDNGESVKEDYKEPMANQFNFNFDGDSSVIETDNLERGNIEDDIIESPKEYVSEDFGVITDLEDIEDFDEVVDVGFNFNFGLDNTDTSIDFDDDSELVDLDDTNEFVEVNNNSLFTMEDETNNDNDGAVEYSDKGSNDYVDIYIESEDDDFVDLFDTRYTNILDNNLDDVLDEDDFIDDALVSKKVDIKDELGYGLSSMDDIVDSNKDKYTRNKIEVLDKDIVKKDVKKDTSNIKPKDDLKTITTKKDNVIKEEIKRGTKKKGGGLTINPVVKTNNSKPITKVNRIATISAIKDYILINGEGKIMKKKILKTDLQSKFNGNEIGLAIDSGVILSEGDYFLLVYIG